MITFFVTGEPKAQARPRAFAMKFGNKYQARVYNPGTAEEWKSAIAMAAKPFLPEKPLEGPLEIVLAFYFKRPKSHYRSNGELKANAPRWHTSKPDRDNLEKAVLDALTQIGMFRDDSAVCDGSVRKFYETQYMRPGCSVLISQKEQP